MRRLALLLILPACSSGVATVEGTATGAGTTAAPAASSGGGASASGTGTSGSAGGSSASGGGSVASTGGTPSSSGAASSTAGASSGGGSTAGGGSSAGGVTSAGSSSAGATTGTTTGTATGSGGEAASSSGGASSSSGGSNGGPADGGVAAAPFFAMNVNDNPGVRPYPDVYGASAKVGPGVVRFWDTATDWPTTWRRSDGTISLATGSTIVSGSGTSFDGTHAGATLAFADGQALVAYVDGGVATLAAPWTGPPVTAESYRAYGWTTLDQLADAVAAHGARLHYVWWLIPSVDTGNGTDALCHGGAGTCYPPLELHDAGACAGSLAGTTTTDCEVKTYTTDLLQHLIGRGTPPAYLELGNEVNLCSNNYGVNGASCPAQSHVSKSDAEWCGSIADYATLVGDVAAVTRALSPATEILGPGVTAMGTCSGAAGNSGPDWLAQWFSLGGGGLIDVVAFHGYLGTVPETMDSCLSSFQAFVGGTPAAGKPIEDTEYSWSGSTNAAVNGGAVADAVRDGGLVTVTLDDSILPSALDLDAGASVALLGLPDPSFDGVFPISAVDAATFAFDYVQAGPDARSAGTGPTGLGTAVLASNLPLERDFVARTLLIQYARGLQAAVWYGGTSNFIGTLCDAWTSSACTSRRPAGTAWGEVARWLSGAGAGQPCSAAGGVWSCAFTLPGGAAALAVWDTDGGTSYPVPAGMTEALDLDGGVTNLAGGTVAISTAPILLE
ncbi:MAG TPA: hypothetical protein VMB50_02880 [Myxococcales bacterium]|nr:hypothetical protein [Myxococcales bacterium]